MFHKIPFEVEGRGKHIWNGGIVSVTLGAKYQLVGGKSREGVRLKVMSTANL